MPTIYNNQNIQDWGTEAQTLSRRNQENQQLIAEHNQTLIPLQSQQQSLQLQINTVQSQINTYRLQMAQDNYYHHDHYHHHYHHHHNPGLLHTALDVFSALDLARLEGQLSDLQAQASRLDGEIQPHLRQIRSSRALIDEANQRLTWLNHHIAQGSAFLNTLRTNPQILVQNLKSRIGSALKKYEEEHPQGLSPQVRICLWKIQEKLNFLSSNQGNVQINYLQLCALLQDMHLRVSAERQNKEFTELLNALLEESHVGSDLPDEMQTNSTTAQHYLLLQQQNPGLFNITPDNLLFLEQEAYQAALVHLQQAAAPANMLQCKIGDAVQVINNEVEAKKLNNELPDYHFYILALTDLAILKTNPQDAHTAQNLGLLANAANGSPSLGKQIGGALLAVVGVALIVASITCLAMTFGGSSFASAFGVAVGLSLLQSQITLSIAATLSITAGISFTLWGSSICKEGQRQGLSKELEAVKEEALHPTLV